jgi:hypothetical protein
MAATDYSPGLTVRLAISLKLQAGVLRSQDPGMRAGTSCAYMGRRNARSCPDACRYGCSPCRAYSEIALVSSYRAGAEIRCDADTLPRPLTIDWTCAGTCGLACIINAFVFISPDLSIASPRSRAISGARVGSMISRGSTKSGALLCFGNVSHSAQGVFKSAPERRPQRGGGERWGHRVWLCSTTARGRGRERSPIKPAHAGSATMVSIDHLWKFSTASDLF